MWVWFRVVGWLRQTLTHMFSRGDFMAPFSRQIFPPCLIFFYPPLESSTHTSILQPPLPPPPPPPLPTFPPFLSLPFIQSILTFGLLTQEARSSHLVLLVPLARNRASRNGVHTDTQKVCIYIVSAERRKWLWLQCHNDSFTFKSRQATSESISFFSGKLFIILKNMKGKQTVLEMIFCKSVTEVVWKQPCVLCTAGPLD